MGEREKRYYQKQKGTGLMYKQEGMEEGKGTKR